jgi:coenzyme F420 biosynthesis associated uncharacterized protein
MIDWTLAQQIARFAARSDDVPELGVDMAELAEELGPAVRGHSRLSPDSALPRAEVLGRASWAEANLQSLAPLIDPVAARLDRRLDNAGPFAGALRAGAGVTLAAELGLVMGYMSQRVLGQYELSLLGPESASPRLLFVAPNLAGAVEALDVDRESFLRWVTIHELVHALQFASVPWLRGHLADLLREYLSTVDVRIERGTAGGLPSLPDLPQLAERFREGGLAAFVQSQEQRRILDLLQAAMAVVEGHAEHLMDALAPELVPHHEGLRDAMTRRRRSRSAPERILMRLLGMDMKMRQYELGKSFCDALAAEGGIDLLNRVWSAPTALPSLAELEHPADWIARVGGATPALSGEN